MANSWSSSPCRCQNTDGAIPVPSVLYIGKSFLWGHCLSFWPAYIKNGSEGFYLATRFITEIIRRNLMCLLHEWCWDEQIKQNQTGRTCSSLRKALEACRILIIEPRDGTKHRLKDIREKNLVSSEMIFRVFVRIKITVVWVLAPRNLAILYQRLWTPVFSAVKNEAEYYCETLFSLHQTT